MKKFITYLSTFPGVVFMFRSVAWVSFVFVLRWITDSFGLGIPDDFYVCLTTAGCGFEAFKAKLFNSFFMGPGNRKLDNPVGTSRPTTPQPISRPTEPVPPRPQPLSPRHVAQGPRLAPIAQRQTLPPLTQGPRLAPIVQRQTLPPLTQGPRFAPIVQRQTLPSLTQGPRFAPVSQRLVPQVQEPRLVPQAQGFAPVTQGPRFDPVSQGQRYVAIARQPQAIIPNPGLDNLIIEHANFSFRDRISSMYLNSHLCNAFINNPTSQEAIRANTDFLLNNSIMIGNTIKTVDCSSLTNMRGAFRFRVSLLIDNPGNRDMYLNMERQCMIVDGFRVPKHAINRRNQITPWTVTYSVLPCGIILEAHELERLNRTPFDFSHVFNN